ncbi:C4-dicarboxylate transporter, large subunit [Candidatus Moduliflexus flocculans]|uniref:C4-dicarboxylate transporter, large subunit n=1 Tax=Candidatus Moduliflexus flocculans TaxID=1499966 RepID=A0A0S6W0N3_9BACT|nr:C4-dicarboxylate transporter, large subunit [Candidatus Moduliflexus flocculans]
MELLITSLTLAGLLVVFLGGSLWIGMSLFLVGFGGLTFFLDIPAGTLMANVLWNGTNGSAMLALPLFVLMGEILFRSRIAENLFQGLSPWMDRIPGRLLHVNIFASAMFAAVSGSSAATTATVGKITLREFQRRQYNMSISIGSLAGAGTLGFLIPPSMVMLVYGIMADVSIGKLFIAGFLPGILLALIFSGYIIACGLRDAAIAPPDETRYTWKDRLYSLPLLAPVIILILIVLGSIYTGWATPTEASAVGVVGSLFFAMLTKSLDWQAFKAALMGAVKTNCMIMWIVCGASYLSVSIGYLGITQSISEYIASLHLSPYLLIFILTLMYIVMGCLLDGFSMIVMSLPITLPLIKQAGFDPIWFGIYLVVMIEMAQITPPVGFNLFVIKGLTDKDVGEIAMAALPFFLLMCAATVLLTVFPQIVLYLPGLMTR